MARAIARQGQMDPKEYVYVNNLTLKMGYSSILLLSYSMSGVALESPSLLLPYSIITTSIAYSYHVDNNP